MSGAQFRLNVTYSQLQYYYAYLTQFLRGIGIGDLDYAQNVCLVIEGDPLSEPMLRATVESDSIAAIFAGTCSLWASTVTSYIYRIYVFLYWINIFWKRVPFQLHGTRRRLIVSGASC